MPALTLSEAASAVLINTMAPVTPTVVDSLRAEKFLLVQEVTDRASRTVLRKINQSGRCYMRVDYDFQLFHDVVAHETSPFGLADFHPGAQLGPAEIEFLNGINTYGASGGVFIYGSVSRRRLPGGLPGMAFTIDREGCTITIPGTQPNVVDVTTGGGTPGDPGPTARFDLIYGITVVWTRYLSLSAPLGGAFFTGVLTYSRPLRYDIIAPADLTAFLAAPSTGVEGLGNTITEVIVTKDYPGGNILRPGSGALLTTMSAGAPLGATTNNFLWSGHIPGGSPITYQGYAPNATSWEDVVGALASPDDIPGRIDGKIVDNIYDIQNAAFLAPP